MLNDKRNKEREEGKVHKEVGSKLQVLVGYSFLQQLIRK